MVISLADAPWPTLPGRPERRLGQAGAGGQTLATGRFFGQAGKRMGKADVGAQVATFHNSTGRAGFGIPITEIGREFLRQQFKIRLDPGVKATINKSKNARTAITTAQAQRNSAIDALSLFQNSCAGTRPVEQKPSITTGDPLFAIFMCDL